MTRGVFVVRIYVVDPQISSHDVAYVSDITSCNKIDIGSLQSFWKINDAIITLRKIRES